MSRSNPRTVSFGETVQCDTCGKSLRGRPFVHGFRVSLHRNDLTGKRCTGRFGSGDPEEKP